MTRTVYFDNAATTFPKPECVSYEMYKCMHEYCGNPGRGSNFLAMKASETVYNARCSLKDFFNAPSAENVIFTFNATYALNIAIKCFIMPHSHILISDIEHNAVYRPVVSQAVHGRLSFDHFLTFDGNADKILDDIRKKTRRNTKAIVCTAASNICNLRLPIQKIGQYAKDHGMLFIVDASQLAGHTAIDMQNSCISILCGPFHKGLYGPQGGGFMIVNKNVEAYSTLIEGGSGVNSLDMRMPHTLPEMFEAGTLSTPGAAGLIKALEYLSTADMNNIERYEKRLSAMLREVFTKYNQICIHGDYNDGGVFSLTSETHSPEELACILDSNGIMIRSGHHCAPLCHKKLKTAKTGTVRFSLGIFNTESDIDYLDSVLKKIFIS